MLKSSNARADFVAVMKGKNFMTPHILGYYYCGDYAVELSEGTGMEHEPIFGVTVVNTVTAEAEHDLSKMFYSKQEATAYLKELSK